MSSSNPSITAALAAAEEMILVAAGSAVGEAANNLMTAMRSAATYHERGQLAFAQVHILDTQRLFLASFAAALREQVAAALEPRGEAAAERDAPDWKSLSLVDEGQVEDQISFERIGQLIAHAAEAELRELTGYMSAMLDHGWPDPARNPLRGDVLGSALYKAIEKITDEPVTQKILARELGQGMASAMPACYREIVADLKHRAIRPADLAARPPPESRGRGAAARDAGFEQARQAWEVSWQGRIDRTEPPPGPWESSLVGRLPLPTPGLDGLETSAALFDRMIRGNLTATRSAAVQAADAEMMQLLRRLNGGASYRGEFDALPRDTGYGSFSGLEREELSAARHADAAAAPPGGLSGLVAANLIRAHREELMQAARGKVDHLVIDVVSSLFDQVLSDARVPPQMARQIARLQLPVLRVALADPSFFSSRRHPVRRFINRTASLACAFDDFDGGPARDLLARVAELVQEIVDGDFDQLELYEAKLHELERFIAERTHSEVRDSPAAPTLREKELEWRVQQRFSRQLREALEPLTLPPFVRDFLAGVWAQAIVLASRRDGADAVRPQQLRRTGAELVRSIQPKRSPEQRTHFIATLPALMAELTAGMRAVAWPKASQDDFFGLLISQHAGSLKAAPQSELEYNLMLRQLDAAFSLPLPGAEETRDDELPTTASMPLPEQQFSAEEERALGLIQESAIDWSDGDAGSETVPAPLDGESPSAGFGAAAPAAVDPLAAPPPELAAGPQLREHLQLGFSYRLKLGSQWEKVRLTYMSPGRSLFLFTHGAKDRESISMTARTLGRLCETGRMRAFEQAYLIDRATQRAREQLAAQTPRR